MTDSTKSSDRPQYCRDATWYPLRTGWQPTYISNQHFGLPPFLTPGDLNSMDSVFRKLAALSWPGYRWCPQPGSPTHSKLQRGLLGRAAEARRDQYRWRVSLDVNHFFPTELSVRTTDGFLEISGKHEERRDDHGFISRSFTRKYKLPIGIDPQTIRSSLCGDGILTVEAPLPKIPQPQIVIPVQIEKEPLMPGAEKKEDPRMEDAINRERESQNPQFAGRKPSPTSPTRQAWAPKEGDYSQGGQTDQASAEFSTDPFAPQSSHSETQASGQDREDIREAHTQQEETGEEAQDQFTDLSEAPATPDTLTSEQEESSDVVQDGGAQQQQDQQHGGEATGERHEEDLHREGDVGEEMSGEQAPESTQFQELVIPEQEVLVS